MNIEAVNDAHALFKGGGYNGTIEDFQSLIATNDEALSDTHKLFTKGGYTGDIKQFSTLVGVKKKDEVLGLDSESEEVVTTSVTEEVEEVVETSSTCVHIMTRGKSIGEECGKKSTGAGLCKTHGKAAKKRKGKLKKVKDPTKTSPTKKKRLVLRHHPYFTDMFVHKPTGFLIKDKKEGVIGKIKEGEGKEPPTIDELTAEDLVEITKLGMKSKKQ